MRRNRQYWGCYSCKNRKNPGDSKHCDTCGEPRNVDRFAISVLGQLLLCKVHLTCRIPKVTVLDVASDPARTHSRTLILQTTEFSLRDCVEVTLLHEAAAKQAEGEDNVGEETEQEQQERSTAPSILSAAAQPVTRSLYEQVLYNATQMAYDSNIGRWVPKDTVEKGDHIKTNLLYAEQLKCAVGEKRRIVRSLVGLREQAHVSPHFHNNQNDLRFKLQRIKNEKKEPCALCQHQFPLSALRAQITMKRLEKYLCSRIPSSSSDKFSDLLSTELKRAAKYANAAHLTVKLCTFCYQFFDDGSFFDAADVIASIKNEVEEHLISSPLRLAQQMHQSLTEGGDERPASASATKMDAALSKLRMKHSLDSLGLRYQRIEDKGIRKGGILDQQRFGRFLRDKYSDVSKVMKEVQKNERKLQLDSQKSQSSLWSQKSLSKKVSIKSAKQSVDTVKVEESAVEADVASVPVSVPAPVFCTQPSESSECECTAVETEEGRGVAETGERDAGETDKKTVLAKKAVAGRTKTSLVVFIKKEDDSANQTSSAQPVQRLEFTPARVQQAKLNRSESAPTVPTAPVVAPTTAAVPESRPVPDHPVKKPKATTKRPQKTEMKPTNTNIVSIKKAPNNVVVKEVQPPRTEKGVKLMRKLHSQAKIGWAASDTNANKQASVTTQAIPHSLQHGRHPQQPQVSHPQSDLEQSKIADHKAGATVHPVSKHDIDDDYGDDDFESEYEADEFEDYHDEDHAGKEPPADVHTALLAPGFADSMFVGVGVGQGGRNAPADAASALDDFEHWSAICLSPIDDAVEFVDVGQRQLHNKKPSSSRRGHRVGTGSDADRQLVSSRRGVGSRSAISPSKSRSVKTPGKQQTPRYFEFLDDDDNIVEGLLNVSGNLGTSRSAARY
jgi:hypothetical protein